MKLIHTLLFILLYVDTALGARLVWPDFPDGRLYAIDTEQQTLTYEDCYGVWHPAGRVTLAGVIEADLPPIIRVKSIETSGGSGRYLLLDCTQQVYRFDFTTRKLERMDHTYFRGYNCYASKFLRNDTLYSFGGYGFWQTNNLQTFFKAENREWEGLKAGEGGPASICFGFTGYLPEADQFLVSYSLLQRDAKSENPVSWDRGVYLYSFGQKAWQQLGEVSEAVDRRIKPDLINRTSWFQAGRYFILKHYESPYATFILVDILKNEARQWEDAVRMLTGVEDNSEAAIYRTYTWRDTLYLHTTATNKFQKPIEIIRLPVAQLWESAKPIGPFYKPKASGYRGGYQLALVLVSLLVLAGFFGFKKWGQKPERLTPSAPGTVEAPFDWTTFTEQEKTVLLRLARTTDDTFGNDALNTLLNLEEKSLDNQRKIRAEFFKNLNRKLTLVLDVEEGIQRKPMAMDRRMFYYQLHPEIAQQISGTAPPSRDTGTSPE